MIVGARDPFGFERLHYLVGEEGLLGGGDAAEPQAVAVNGAVPWGSGIRNLLQVSGGAAGEADVDAIRGYLSEMRGGQSTGASGGVRHDVREASLGICMPGANRDEQRRDSQASPRHEIRSSARLAGRTVLRNVRAVPPGHMLERTSSGLRVHARPIAPQPGDLQALLRDAIQRVLASGQRVALALSGGLDSALLLVLLKELGVQQDIPAYILATGMPDYCERDAALDIAQRLGARVKVVQVTGPDFVRALPRATRCVEEPMFNLHPVAKLLLAEAMAADGIQAALSGDGADQVMRRDVSANYLPLCNALFGAASVRLHAPFIDTAVVQHLISLPPDPGKQCLRDLGSTLGLPDRLVRGPKRGRLAPAMDLSSVMDRGRILALAGMLNLDAPTLDTDIERMQWTTLALTLDHLQAPLQP
ncbi:O-antigen biosynthesis aminotransferase [Bordetella ansorpii]|uniref:asparagine synthase (glutamine-hydrolyzing) n=2 Tax=Bordetella ansorpii TaxID=288768 RepID=A0A157PNN4_9BORD|nr:O-antigen biosynthesis aminotransferase [Bordetella ansorpii]